jgi:hypothetical protein
MKKKTFNNIQSYGDKIKLCVSFCDNFYNKIEDEKKFNFKLLAHVSFFFEFNVIYQVTCIQRKKRRKEKEKNGKNENETS